MEAVDNVDPDWVIENYSERTDSNLCLIGEAFNGYMALCMSPKGEVYAGFDETLVYVGVSGEEAINKLCLGHELAKVPELNTGLSDDLKDSIKNVSLVTNVKVQLKKLKKVSDQQHDIIQLVEKNWRKYFQKKDENVVLIPKISNSTEHCLEQMVKSEVFLSLGGIVYFIGIHPKNDMKKSEIKNYIIEHSKKRGFYVPKRNIETKFIPETKFAFTAYVESVPNPAPDSDAKNSGR